eukprot:2808897-Pleurochrysis_carterae.AAC.2
MNEALAEALVGALGGGGAGAGAVERRGADEVAAAAEGGGRLADGAGLAGGVREAVAAAQATPAPFASPRNLEPEDEERLVLEPLPGDLREPQP